VGDTVVAMNTANELDALLAELADLSERLDDFNGSPVEKFWPGQPRDELGRFAPGESPGEVASARGSDATTSKEHVKAERGHEDAMNHHDRQAQILRQKAELLRPMMRGSTVGKGERDRLRRQMSDLRDAARAHDAAAERHASAADAHHIAAESGSPSDSQRARTMSMIAGEFSSKAQEDIRDLQSKQ
jgi:hypothetical protein